MQYGWTIQESVIRVGRPVFDEVAEIFNQRDKTKAKILHGKLCNSLVCLDTWIFSGMKTHRKRTEIDLIWALLNNSLSMLWHLSALEPVAAALSMRSAPQRDLPSM